MTMETRDSVHGIDQSDDTYNRVSVSLVELANQQQPPVCFKSAELEKRVPTQHLRY